MILNPKTAQFGWPTLPIDTAALEHVFGAMAGRVKYHLGSKPSIHAEPENVTLSDCSGFVRLALFQATHGKCDIGDGSQAQGDVLARAGLKVSTLGACRLHDGLWRAVIRKKTTDHEGHIVLVRGGHTFECCGGLGVCSRKWTGEGWQGETTNRVFVLTRPE